VPVCCWRDASLEIVPLTPLSDTKKCPIWAHTPPHGRCFPRPFGERMHRAWLRHGKQQRFVTQCLVDLQATQAWGRNLVLAEHLLKLGATADYSMFAACWNDDVPALDLLLEYGALVDDLTSARETPFLGAIAWSRFRYAEALLDRGADVNAKSEKGLTAFHIMLNKGRTSSISRCWRSMVHEATFRGRMGRRLSRSCRTRRTSDFGTSRRSSVALAKPSSTASKPALRRSSAWLRFSHLRNDSEQLVQLGLHGSDEL
jgi:hypothetical protein